MPPVTWEYIISSSSRVEALGNKYNDVQHIHLVLSMPCTRFPGTLCELMRCDGSHKEINEELIIAF